MVDNNEIILLLVTLSSAVVATFVAMKWLEARDMYRALERQNRTVTDKVLELQEAVQAMEARARLAEDRAEVYQSLWLRQGQEKQPDRLQRVYRNGAAAIVARQNGGSQ